MRRQVAVEQLADLVQSFAQFEVCPARFATGSFDAIVVCDAATAAR
jgi:hypothetical protein